MGPVPLSVFWGDPARSSGNSPSGCVQPLPAVTRPRGQSLGSGCGHRVDGKCHGAPSPQSGPLKCLQTGPWACRQDPGQPLCDCLSPQLTQADTEQGPQSGHSWLFKVTQSRAKWPHRGFRNASRTWSLSAKSHTGDRVPRVSLARLWDQELTQTPFQTAGVPWSRGGRVAALPSCKAHWPRGCEPDSRSRSLPLSLSALGSLPRSWFSGWAMRGCGATGAGARHGPGASAPGRRVC